MDINKHPNHLTSHTTPLLHVEIEEISSLEEPLIRDYPFSGQDIISGKYTYESQPRFGAADQSEGSFQIRSGPGLLLVEIASDRPGARELVNHFDSAINSGSSISKDFVPTRSEVWSFIEMADSVIDIRVMDETGSTMKKSSLEYLDDYSRFTVLEVKLQFSTMGNAVVDYSGDQLSIHGGGSKGEEAVLQAFESALKG